MGDRELADQVLAHVNLDRAMRLAQEICRIPSVLGEEGPLASFLAGVMKEAGFEAAGLQPVLPDRPNAVGEMSFGSGPRVVLTGHMDTKPGPRTLELAGGLADGVILLVGLFPDAITWALEHIDRGARAAGRPRPHTALFAYGAVSDDEPAALAAARSIGAWFPQTAPHLCRLAGLPDDIAAAVRASYAGGEFQEAQNAAGLLPDSFVRRMALAGDAREASERVRDVLRAGVDSVHVFPLGPDRMATVRAFAGAVPGGIAQPASAGDEI